MTKKEKEMKKCCTAEADKEWYKKEYQSLFEENAKLKIIIDLLIEELYRRPKQDD